MFKELGMSMRLGETKRSRRKEDDLGAQYQELIHLRAEVAKLLKQKISSPRKRGSARRPDSTRLPWRFSS